MVSRNLQEVPTSILCNGGKRELNSRMQCFLITDSSISPCSVKGRESIMLYPSLLIWVSKDRREIAADDGARLSYMASRDTAYYKEVKYLDLLWARSVCFVSDFLLDFFTRIIVYKKYCIRND